MMRSPLGSLGGVAPIDLSSFSFDIYSGDQLRCRYDASMRTVYVEIMAKGIPCITRGLLDEMEKGSHALERVFAPHASDRRCAVSKLHWSTEYVELRQSPCLRETR